ncbi:Retrovirus-related Pol polyprotein from transposon 17.6,Retrovirus-related Pol polyprotein from transposon 412,Retrovirus-related Pol polyprotein from transposon 297 [Mytilus edulis]|uniref:Retrovirus-related Pol polyprotein from transposon 17.6,Retrovirus-related Pol polyprotein from transposon 412,Retrovirus-related Pol polyprotein from transposon 297 n=1 Tax=Mytilus edulis TaxID=6550 RepID=A0A8S3PXF0_MYTED|nr:Retrovirus-related Pol polyprotein from transposon 17.6,Retrovirus-related Pol polyprotein from transposon 412,Retrovirus-related Pol polyprotein from transposon 297 [Mytilus edulis]
MTNDTPFQSRPYRTTPTAKKEIDRQVAEMLEHDIIEPSNSPYSSPVVLVRKKNNAGFRFAIDYRRINEFTVPLTFAIPRLEDIIDTVASSKAALFSVVDLSAGFWQIGLDKESRPKSAFITHDNLYQFKRMPFGITNASFSFQMAMNQILRGLTWKHCLVYIDDIIVWSENFEQHIKHLGQVFDRLQEANMTIKPTKCEFAKSEVLYLGHIFSDKGIKVDDSKIQAVKSFPIPNNQHDVRSFLGLCNYYRKFVKNYSKIAAPITHLLKKNMKFKWTSDCNEAFETLKQALITAPILKYPDFEKEFILACDASTQAIGYILSQKDENGQERPIGYGGRNLSSAERNYTVTELELLALVKGISYFHVYLANSKFTVYTDHKALCWLKTIKNNSTRLMRWALQVQEYNFEVCHRSGSKNTHADALSRRKYDLNDQEDGTDDKPIKAESIDPEIIPSIPQGHIFEIHLSHSDTDSKVNALPTINNITNVDTVAKNIGIKQRQCPYFKYIYEYLLEGKLPDNIDKKKNIPYESMQYEMLNEVLYHVFQPRAKKTKRGEVLLQIAVPQELRNSILIAFHDNSCQILEKSGGETYSRRAI